MGTSATGETQVYRYAGIQGEEIRREADSGRREIGRKMYLTPLIIFDGPVDIKNLNINVITLTRKL